MSEIASRIKRKAAIGFFWDYGASMSGRVLILVATLILARVLAPEEFGLVAFALAILAYVDRFIDLGASQSLIYRSDAKEPSVSSTAFWIGVAGALVLTAAGWVAAPYVAQLGDDPDLVWIFRLLILQFPLMALLRTPYCLLRHSLEFRKLFLPEFGAGLLKGGVSVALALAGMGIWSLVFGQLAGTLARMVGIWVASGWRPRFQFVGAHVPSMIRYGLAVVAVAILGQGIRNFDYLVIGIQLGATELGFYLLAFRLPELVILGAFEAGYRVLFSTYARLQDLEVDGSSPPGRTQLVRGYLESVRLGSLTGFPLSFGMAALALPLVLTLYGDRWRPSAAPLALIALWTGFSAVGGMPGTVFKALGRPGILVYTALVYVVVLVPALWLAAGFGITAVAGAVLATQVAYLLFLSAVVGRVLALPWHRTLTELAPGLVLGIVTAVPLYGLAVALPPLLALVAAIPVGAVIYVALLRRFLPDDFRILRARAQKLRARRSRTAGPDALEPEPEL